MRDGQVSLWDLRQFKSKCPISTADHHRSVLSVEFSPISGNYLATTCFNDFIGILSCDLTHLKIENKIKHNMNTGRWLKHFVTRFIPGRDDAIMIGSMLWPRQVSVLNLEGTLLHKFVDEELQSVLSIVAMHPHMPMFAGINSSGKTYLFESS